MKEVHDMVSNVVIAHAVRFAFLANVNNRSKLLDRAHWNELASFNVFADVQN